MAGILVRFWLRRFALVFVLAGIGLGAVEAMRRGLAGLPYGSVLGWSATAALLAASLATWWAWSRQCRVVFKPPQ
jgi:hypothetical protein